MNFKLTMCETDFYDVTDRNQTDNLIAVYNRQMSQMFFGHNVPDRIPSPITTFFADPFQWRRGIDPEVFYSVALDTANVVVFFGVEFKSHTDSVRNYFSDSSVLLKDFQITINRAEANSRQFSPYLLVNKIGCWMIIRFSEHINDDLTLPGNPVCLF